VSPEGDVRIVGSVLVRNEDAHIERAIRNAADACDYRDAARSADRSSCGYADGRSTPSPSADETTNNAASLGIPRDRLGAIEAHIHVPAGAIPKDGPSAGIAIATALVSEMADRPVRRDVAMTGEITLRGRVLPIGGLKEKVLGAHRAGIKTIILPKANEADIEDVPEEVRNVLSFHPVETLREVLEIALVPEAPATVKPLEIAGAA